MSASSVSELPENCIRNTTTTYGEILARKSRKRFWCFEMGTPSASICTARRPATSPRPPEQRTAHYEFPYKTTYCSKYGLAEESIHEIGHSVGLGHDYEDATGNALSENDCDLR